MKTAVCIAILFLAVGASGQQRQQHIVTDTAAHIAPMQTFRVADKAPRGIPQDFYTQHLPFFCRQELRMQQAKVPITFRLGSMEQCNRLEQKPGYR